MANILDMVKVLSFALSEGKVSGGVSLSKVGGTYRVVQLDLGQNLKYYVCGLIDCILILKNNMYNTSISGVESSWTAVHVFTPILSK